MESDASFGWWLRRRRKAFDLTQEALAAQVGCAVTTIRKIEADTRRPSRQIAEILAEVLKVAPGERAAFLQAARAELAVDRLSAPTPPLGLAAAAASPRPWPSGTVTFLFSDIEGSTQLWERHPRAIPHALARHDAILRTAIEERGGVVFRTVGDAFCAAFTRAPDALAAAIAAQRTLRDEAWPATGPLHVRIALHTGVVEVRAGDYLGQPLNRVERLLASSHGGQILLSRATEELVSDHMPLNVTLRDLGVHRLRDLSRPEHIFQAVAADLPADFPPLALPDERLFHLPIPLTPLIGRETEVAEVGHLLDRAECRLLTIVGPGGIGKTRLAIAAATAQGQAYPDGVYFVALASLSAPEFIVPAIAEAVGCTFYGPTEPKAQLFNYLRAKHALLVVDNVEHLLDGAGILSELLEYTPALKLLITSRERLRLQGEWVVDLQGLPVPPAHQTDQVETYSAVGLFVERAQRARTGFTLSERNQADVARICQLVDGLPLGIELAAAWVPTLSCGEIAQEIGRNLDFLTTSMRDVPTRHHSVRAVFDHSWNLLSAEEQRVLRQLSVFRGGFTRAAAVQVAGASLRDLAGLVAKSLVSLTPGGRYHLHELLRQFSADKLDSVPTEQAATCERHSIYFLTFLQEREAGIQGKQPKVILDEIQAEMENVRASWSWAVEHRQVEVIGGILDSLYQFYRLRSHFQEGEEAFRRAAKRLEETASQPQSTTQNPLDACEAKSTPIRRTVQNRLLARQGAFCIQLGRYDVAGDLLENSLALARRWEIQTEIAFCLLCLGDVVWKQEDYSKVEHMYRESLTISQVVGDHLKMAEALARLGWLTTATTGDHLTAQSYYEQGLELLRQTENLSGMAFLLDNLGGNAFWVGKYPEAEHYYQESLALFKEIGNRHGIGKALGGLGLVAWGCGGARLNEAIQLYQESLAICQEIGHRSEIEQRLLMLGHVSNSMGRYEEAQRYLQGAWDMSKQISQTFTASWTLSGLGEAALGLGNLQAARHYLLEALETTRIPAALLAMMSWAMLLKEEADLSMASVVSRQEALANHEKRKRAVAILSLVINHPAPWQVYKDKAGRLLAELEAELPPEVFAAAEELGKAKTVEEVVAELLAANAG